MLAAIITLVTNVSGRDNCFNYEVIFYDLVKRYDVINHFHGICCGGPFEKCFHEGTIWR